ncbi:hypothetical protein C8R45DRAFT_1204167 [Mycena sanguinolenta]|nr:hypothetical protein C8R45DRAFT_1204167 [Mycena sanguinolenta]
MIGEAIPFLPFSHNLPGAFTPYSSQIFYSCCFFLPLPTLYYPLCTPAFFLPTFLSFSMSTFTPLSAADDNAWTPSMPNSDLWTLGAATQPMSPPNPMVHRRVIAIRTSPLGRFPSVTADTLVVTAESVSVDAASSKQHLAISTFAQSLQSSPSRATLGLGHPSNSKRCSSSLESDSVASPQASPQKRPRINSSTIKRRTGRFPACTLYSIPEHPVTTTTQQKGISRPVPEARKHSYAEAASAVETPTKRNDKRVTPTSPASPRPRCASKYPSNASLSSITALAPRYTSSGSPQAGPTQVQSPRVLAPTTMAGSPNFQSLDGAVLAITVAAIEERSEVEETECQLRMEELYGEDGFIKFKVHAQLRIRFAARRLKMLF